jgi:PKD-like domain
MKTKLFFILFFVATVGFGQAIFSNPIIGVNINPNSSNPYITDQFVDPNINGSDSGLFKSSGISGFTTSDRYNADNWTTSNTLDLNKYFEFKITPNSGYNINFTDLIFNSRLSSNSATWVLRASTDNFVSNIVTVFNPETIGTGTSAPANLFRIVSLSAFQNISSSISFRIYVYGVAGTNRTFSIDDFSFNGNVLSTSPVCIFSGTPLTQAGSTHTFCIDNPNNSLTLTTGNTTNIPTNSGQYVAVNVVKGFKYSFSVGDVFAGLNENLTLFNDTNTATSIGFNSSASGTAINNWTAPFSGIVRVLLSKGACVNDDTTGGNITLTLNAIGNTQDSQTLAGTDSWVGHVYNYAGGNSPGGASPTTLPPTSPFLDANYVGYITQTDNFTNTFGPTGSTINDITCFDVLSNNNTRVTITNKTFAIRYRMKVSSAKTGCFYIRTTSDDGSRLYLNGTLVPLSNMWFDHGSRTHGVILNLSLNDELVFDFYENTGGNSASFTMTPFNGSTNTITTTNNAICNGSSAVLDGSNFNITGISNLPFFSYQWQESPDGISGWTNLTGPGTTLEDYTTTAYIASPGTVETKYYRRQFIPLGTPIACGAFNSNVILVSNSDCSACSLTGATQQGTIATTLCIDNPTATTVSLNAGKYILLNVVQGFTYRFSVGDVFAGTEENITLFDAATDTSFAPAGSLKGLTGLTLTWTSTLSGQIKVLLSKGLTCLNDGSTGGLVTLNIVSLGNTFDDQTAKGNDTWIGHVYNSAGGSPGGFPSPATLSTSIVPFSNSSYVGYYNVTLSSTAPPNFSDFFVGSSVCFPVLTNGVQRTTIYTETFAVRYRMNNISRTGCYLLNILGADDGVRLYYDNTLVYDDWTDHGSRTYNNVFVNLAANKELVLDYYENGGVNSVGISFTPFDIATNTIAPIPNVCSGSSATLNASNYLINGAANPFLTFQWQISNDDISWTDISGATLEDYTTIAITTAVPETRYYRRIVTPTSAPSCALTSASVRVITSPGTPTTQVITNNSSICSTQKTFSVPSDPNVVTYTWSAPTAWGTPVSGQGTNTIIYNTTTAGGTVGLTLNNGCGNTVVPSVNVPANLDTTWNGVWSNGVPDGTRKIIFAGNYPMNSNLLGCSCQVNSGSTVTVASGYTLNLINELTVATGGSMTFENNSSLVQQNSTIANTGNITYKRITQPVRRFDYTYWSTPVADTRNLSVIFPGTLSDKYLDFNAIVNDWNYLPPTTSSMTVGRGYAIRAPQTNLISTAAPVLYSFVGTPNNGNITLPSSLIGAATNYNLIGNPYPSALYADQFIATNGPLGTGVLNGTLYFWTHNTARTAAISYSYTTDDYASYNLTGGVGTGTGDDANSGGAIPSGYIAAGQSFFVESGASAPGNILFNNTMRVAGNNNQFYRTSKKTTSNKSRIWLNMYNESEVFKQLLVGYVNGATNNWDNLYDAESLDGNIHADFYSINSDKKLVIQARETPFASVDEVPLGYRSKAGEPLQIAIEKTDGELENLPIYLEDKKQNIIYDLRQGSYQFVPIIGQENDRFVLKFANQNLLNTNKYIEENNVLLVYKRDKSIIIDAVNRKMKNVKIYDLLGRVIHEEEMNQSAIEINDLKQNNQILLVRTTLENGKVKIDKLVF